MDNTDLAINIGCLIILIGFGLFWIYVNENKPAKISKKQIEDADKDQAKIIKYIGSCNSIRELDRALQMIMDFQIDYTGVISHKEVDSVVKTCTDFMKECRKDMLLSKINTSKV